MLRCLELHAYVFGVACLCSWGCMLMRLLLKAGSIVVTACLNMKKSLMIRYYLLELLLGTLWGDIRAGIGIVQKSDSVM